MRFTIFQAEAKTFLHPLASGRESRRHRFNIAVKIAALPFHWKAKNPTFEYMHLIAETPRLIIRPFRPDEEEAYLQLFDDTRVNVHLPKRTTEENRAIFLQALKDNDEKAVFNKWAIIHKADSGFVGMGLLRIYNSEADKLEVGYGLHQKYWGSGLATELVKALITYAAKFRQVKNIVAVTTPGNVASMAVLEKAGLVKQGSIVRNNEELIFFNRKL